MTILNRQRARSISATRLASVITRAAAVLDLDEDLGEIVVLIGRDALLHDLNRRYRRKDASTDVLSFPEAGGPGSLGDIAISVDTAERNARAEGRPLARELEVLTLHGFLHLLGYDHEVDDGTMTRLEGWLRRRVLRPSRPSVAGRGRR